MIVLRLIVFAALLNESKADLDQFILKPKMSPNLAKEFNESGSVDVINVKKHIISIQRKMMFSITV